MKRRAFLSLAPLAAVGIAASPDTSEVPAPDLQGSLRTCADYASLRAYTGSATAVQVTGFRVGSSPSGVAGIFTRSEGDRSTPDNGGTVIVAANGVRWKRIYKGPVNPLWFSPPDRNPSTDDGIAIRAALAVGATQLPEDTFNVLSTIVLPTRRKLTGMGVDQSIINSNIPDGPLFTAASSGVSFGYVAHMRINGNGVTGRGGSGHCFSFIDPSPYKGSATPQNYQLEHLWIDGFLGDDAADEKGARRIRSAGIIQYGTLAVTCRHVYISDCGNGFYLRRTQNCRIVDSVVTDIQKAGVFAYDNENLVVDACDLIDCGQDDGTTDPGYPVLDRDLMGVFVSYMNNNLTLSNSKLKGFRGKALIVIKGDGHNINIRSNWIRGDSQWNAPHKAIYAERVSGLNIEDNLFTPSNTGFSETQKYETIELFSRSDAPAFHSTIEGNTFLDPSGFRVAYNIALRGNARTRVHRATIRNNRFGSGGARSAPCVVETDILVKNCVLESSYIGQNSHYAARNVTRATCLSASNVTLRKCAIGPNHFQAGGGAISENYVGMSESVLTDRKAWLGRSTLPIGVHKGEYVEVKGAEPGDFVQVDLEPPVPGVFVTGNAERQDSVRVDVMNGTGRPVNVGGHTVRVRVTKRWAM